jgi:acyl-coenzyme A thioesterase PaaI-like protein
MDTRYLSGTVVPMPDEARIPPFHLPWCFGCGPENEHGLGLEARLEGDRVVADFQFPQRFQGGPGVVHGGGIAAFFDDLMGFVPVAHHLPAVTARLEIHYRRPVPLGASIRGEAWLARADERKLWAESIGTDDGGDLKIEARALFVTVGVDHFVHALDEMPADQRVRLAHYDSGEYYP